MTKQRTFAMWTLTCIVGALFSACQVNDLSESQIPVDLASFRRDSIGCQGLRAQLSYDTLNSLMGGLDNDQVIALLGKPNRVDLRKRSQKFFVYFLEPGPQCADSTPGVPRALLVRFNAVNVVSEISQE